MRFYTAVLDTLTAKGYTAEQKKEIKDQLIAASSYQDTVTDGIEDIPNPISAETHIDKYLRSVIVAKIKIGEELIRRKAMINSNLDLTE